MTDKQQPKVQFQYQNEGFEVKKENNEDEFNSYFEEQVKLELEKGNELKGMKKMKFKKELQKKWPEIQKERQEKLQKEQEEKKKQQAAEQEKTQKKDKQEQQQPSQQNKKSLKERMNKNKDNTALSNKQQPKKEEQEEEQEEEEEWKPIDRSVLEQKKEEEDGWAVAETKKPVKQQDNIKPQDNRRNNKDFNRKQQKERQQYKQDNKKINETNKQQEQEEKQKKQEQEAAAAQKIKEEQQQKLKQKKEQEKQQLLFNQEAILQHINDLIQKEHLDKIENVDFFQIETEHVPVKMNPQYKPKYTKNYNNYNNNMQGKQNSYKNKNNNYNNYNNNYNNNNQNNNLAFKKQQSDDTSNFKKGGRVQKEEPAFKKKLMTIEEKELIETIGKTQNKWMDNALQQNSDENIKIQKDIKFHLQTLSPDNLKQKIKTLLPFMKDKGEYARTELITQLLEKGITQYKYVKTYADFCNQLKSKIKDNKQIYDGFKSQILSEIQNMFNGKKEIIKQPKLLKEMEQEEKEAFLKKRRERLNKLSVYVCELTKLKVVPFKAFQFALQSLFSSHLNHHFYPRIDMKNKDNKNDYKEFHPENGDEYIETTEYIEAIITILEQNGEHIENQETQIKDIKEQEQKGDAYLAELKKFYKLEKVTQYKHSQFEEKAILNFKFYFDFLSYLVEEQIVEPRLRALIQNLQQQKAEGWKLAQSKKNNVAVSKSDIKKQHEQEYQNKLKEAENKSKNNNNNNRQNSNNNQQVAYQVKHDPNSKEFLEQQIQNIKVTKKSKKYMDAKKRMELSLAGAKGIENTKKKWEEIHKVQTDFKISEVEYLYLLFDLSYHGTKDEYKDHCQAAIYFLEKYFQDYKGDNIIEKILARLIEEGTNEYSDFPFMTECYGRIIEALRESKSSSFKFSDLVFETQDDADEDEEVVYFIDDIFKVIYKTAVENKREDLDAVKEEIKQFYINLKKNYQCEIEENHYEEIFE